MSEYQHNQISAPVQVGQVYDYMEDGMLAHVQVLEDTSVAPNGPINLKLKVVRAIHPTYAEDAVFDVFAAEGGYAYSGMWRLYPHGTYGSIPEPPETEDE